MTELLMRWSKGESACLDQIIPLVYKDLREIALRQMGRERRGHTLQPTALINEAYLRLVNQAKVDGRAGRISSESRPG